LVVILFNKQEHRQGNIETKQLTQNVHCYSTNILLAFEPFAYTFLFI